MRKIDVEKIGMFFFYLGVFLEVIIVIMDKSAWLNPIESQLFRITFLLFALKCCVTKYTVRELWTIFAAVCVAGICYLCSTRDEAVRIVIFIISMKNVDVRKALKLVFWETFVGVLLLAVLSGVGILGEIFEAGAGFGKKEGTLRLCLGMGNGNALACMIWALMVLGIYLYYKKMTYIHYCLLLIFSFLVYRLTIARTAFGVMICTVLAAMLLQYFKKIRESKIVYILGIFLVFVGLGFSVFAAYISDWYEFLPTWVVKIDHLLTGRITSIYPFENGGGVLKNWKLFSDPGYVQDFDMGYVRLFFWYGIIPGICCMFVLIRLLWCFYQKKDYMGFVLTMSFAMYTVVEAHAVSVYIARNYVLFLIGAYWPCMLYRNAEVRKQKQVYGWKFITLFKRKEG